MTSRCRFGLGVTLFMIAASWVVNDAAAQVRDIPRRYGVFLDLVNYPQANPKEALESAVKAVERKRFDYVTTQLLDPAYVDRLFKDMGATPATENAILETIARQMEQKYRDEPDLVAGLRKFLQGGELTEKENAASFALKDAPGKAVSLKRVGDRWFLENRTTP